MENNAENNVQPINPPPFPTPRDFRAQAREALKGNWKIALGIMAAVTLISTIITELMSWMGDKYLISITANFVL